jgi:hypothetical protein
MATSPLFSYTFVSVHSKGLADVFCGQNPAKRGVRLQVINLQGLWRNSPPQKAQTPRRSRGAAVSAIQLPKEHYSTSDNKVKEKISGLELRRWGRRDRHGLPYVLVMNLVGVQSHFVLQHQV